MTKKTDTKVRLETITPQRAQADLLKAMGKNYRPLSEPRCKTLAAAITNGDWEVNGETIKYNRAGVLVDGQHRLRAVVLADRSIQSYVVYGVGSDHNIDNGQSRRLTDLLRKQGEKHFKDLAGALGYLWRKANVDNFCVTGFSAIPHSELLRLLKKEPDLREYVSFVNASVPTTIGRRAMLSAFMLHAAAKDEELARWFIDKLGTGTELKEREPVLLLRRRLEEDKTKKAKLTRKEVFALIITAWNSTRNGRELSYLKWNSSGPTAQPFPEIE